GYNKRLMAKKKDTTVVRRIVVVGICALLVVVSSVYVTSSVVRGMKQAAHYTTLDIRQLQFALYAYHAKAWLTGRPAYPATLQDLVQRGVFTQADLSRLLAAYTIEYKQPQPGAPGEAVVFRAQRKPASIVYTVSGQNHIETSNP
ncbi:MAG: hypothetical protein ABI615_03450, partial [Chthoniobacterales bacterium]